MSFQTIRERLYKGVYMRGLIKNISWIFTGNLFSAFTKWFILVLIARILTPIDVGAYALAFAVTAPITILLNLRLRSLVVTDKHLNFSNYIYIRNITSYVAVLLLFLIGLIFYPKYIFLIILVGLNKLYDLFSELYYSIPQLKDDFDFIGKLMILKHVLILVFFVLGIYISQNLHIALLISLVIQVLFFYYVEKRITENKYRITYPNKESKEIKNIIKLGIPLGISLMLVSLNSNIPRYILEYFESAEVLGYFSAVTYILTIGNLVMNSVSQNFLLMLSRTINNGSYKQFLKYLYVYITSFSIALGLIIILFAYFFGEIFLNLVYGASYGKYVDVLVLMSISMAINFVSWGFDTALMSIRYVKIQPFIALTTAITSAVLGYILILDYGIQGAAYTIIVAQVIQLLLRVYFVSYGLKTKQGNLSRNL